MFRRGGDAIFTPASPAPYRHNDLLDPVWNMFDLAPEDAALQPKLDYTSGAAKDVKASERPSGGQEHDLPMVRQGRRGSPPRPFPAARWVRSTVYRVITRPARRETC